MKKQFLFSLFWIAIYIAVLPETTSKGCQDSLCENQNANLTCPKGCKVLITSIDVIKTRPGYNKSTSPSQCCNFDEEKDLIRTICWPTDEGTIGRIFGMIDVCHKNLRSTCLIPNIGNYLQTQFPDAELMTFNYECLKAGDADNNACIKETNPSSPSSLTSASPSISTSALITEAPTEATTAEETTEEQTTEATTAEQTTEATTAEETTEATTAEETTEATTAEQTTAEETTEATTAEETTAEQTTEATTEETTEATTVEQTTEAATAEETTEATTAEQTTAEETAEATTAEETTAATTAEETTEATTEETTEATTAEQTTEATTEETTEATTDEQTTETQQTTGATTYMRTREATTAGQILTNAQSTVPSTETPVIGGFRPDLENFVIRLNFEISIYLTFKKEFEVPTSSEYQALKTDFHNKLEPIYAVLEGFKELTILRFRNGSTVALHQVHMAANSTDVTKEKLSNISKEIQNLKISNSSVKCSIMDDIDEAVAKMSNKCNARGVCGSELMCTRGETGNPYCVCKADNCKNDGLCQPYTNDRYICSCKTTDDYVYSGEHCEIRTRRALLSEDAIIGLAAGLGGGVMILIIIIFGCLRCEKYRKKKERGSQSNPRDLPELSFPHLNKARLSRLAQGNDYSGKGKPNYGFEPKPFDLRYHKKFNHGRDQKTSGRKQMDDSRRGSQNMSREIYNGEGSHSIYDELGAYVSDSKLSDHSRDSENFRRSAYDRSYERRSADSKRSIQMIPRGNDPSYQLFTGSIREGESVFEYINTERPFKIMRPNIH